MKKIFIRILNEKYSVLFILLILTKKDKNLFWGFKQKIIIMNINKISIIETLSSGTYILLLRDNNGKEFSQKFIKE